MNHIYVLGGVQRPNIKDTQQDWLLFERAVVARVDPETGAGEICLSFETPLQARASAQSSVLFKAGSLAGDRLYLCTSTEVLIYRLTDFSQLAYISLPCFNDLHHVCLTPRGTLAVVSTGLDMVVELTPQGEPVAYWSALGGDPWDRFSPAIDYRQIPTLKPYRAHPNFAFWLDHRLWVTRGDLGGAVCLEAPDRTIALGTTECIHDGVPFAERLYFTSVDGHLIVVNSASKQVEDRLDLNALAPGGRCGYSWCRGVLPVDEHRAWVGFTRIRPTRWKEKIRWIKQLATPVSRPTRLALYDLTRRELLREIDLEALGVHAIFNAVTPTAASPALNVSAASDV